MSSTSFHIEAPSRRSKSACLVFQVLLILAVVAGAQVRSASADLIIHVEALIDGQDQLVITPNGLFWNHVDGIKPGYNGGPENASISGPTYINGAGWIASWEFSDPRVPDVSSVYFINTTGFQGYSLSLSSQYGGEFDNYQGNGQTGTLGPQVDLNRGIVSLTSYNGFPAVRLDDNGIWGGYNVYSFDLISVPEPASLAIFTLGAAALMVRRLRCRS